jgi:hypothetical protein
LKRTVGLWATVVLILSGAGTPAAAQQVPSDKWDVTVAPYFMGAAMSGTTAVRGREVEVDVSASDIFSNLQFGAMGLVVARKGKWGLGGDAIWMALGTTARNTNVDFNQGAFAFYGLRRLGAAADLTAGMRVNTLQGQLKSNTLGFDVSQDKTWVDPLVGLILHSSGERRVQLKVYTEIGGFGLGSDFTWQVFPTVGFKFTDHFSLEAGYRWLDMDYKTGDGNEQFVYDVLTQGPIGGLAFRF